tara:strand:+ start:210 stop:545 length:336 start_codon:yes stop_codon:yes gene_type:complete
MPWGDVNTDGTPKKYLTQQSYIIKPGKVQDFRRWQERIGKINSERRPGKAKVILAIISGGNWQEFIVLMDLTSTKVHRKSLIQPGKKNVIKDLELILAMMIEKALLNLLKC